MMDVLILQWDVFLNFYFYLFLKTQNVVEKIILFSIIGPKGWFLVEI